MSPQQIVRAWRTGWLRMSLSICPHFSFTPHPVMSNRNSQTSLKIAMHLDRDTPVIGRSYPGGKLDYGSVCHVVQFHFKVQFERVGS